MTSHDDRWKAMIFESPELIPVRVGFLPATWMKYRDALAEVVGRHPALFGDEPEDRDYDSVWSPTYGEGEHVDAWGCVWSNIAHGAEAIVTGHPAPTRGSVHQLRPPQPGAGLPHGFMWLRLADLRGFEELMIDFAEEPPELQMLIDTVLEYNVGEMERLLRDHRQPLMHFGDDLGMQDRLAISHEQWVAYLKPCYAKLYGMCQAAESKVYMHTDGHTMPVVMDLAECGVNVINLQIRANGLQRIAEVCRGRVCVDLDLDRQLFPFCSPGDIHDHVREAVEALALPEGGLWLSASCGPDVPLKTIEAICTAMEEYRGYYTPA